LTDLTDSVGRIFCNLAGVIIGRVVTSAALLVPATAAPVISGTSPAAGAIAVQPEADPDNSWVFGVFTSNHLPTISGPFTTTLHNGNSGSSAGDAGYQIVPSRKTDPNAAVPNLP
jgi:hypothetical protein